MKRIFAIVLTIALMLTACASAEAYKAMNPVQFQEKYAAFSARNCGRAKSRSVSAESRKAPLPLRKPHAILQFCEQKRHSLR